MRKNPRLEMWLTILGLAAIVICVLNFSTIVHYVKIFLGSLQSLIFGAMLAFLFNLIMDPVARWLKKAKSPHVRKAANSLALAASILFFFMIIALISSLVIPNLTEAFNKLTSQAPNYTEDIKHFLNVLFKNNPGILKEIEGSNFDWDGLVKQVMAFLAKGVSSTFGSVPDILSGLVNGVVASFVIFIFAIYVCMDKQRFVRLYYQCTDLWLKKEQTARLTHILRTINASFRGFIGGECIEACILTSMCLVGMLILQLPYPTMISVLVGVINMIPMVGAFIGGGIGAFLIFTVSPMKAVVFLIFLVVIQQIESNVFFPRIVGNKVGLPGIYVMMVIVVGGTLFGVFGMVLGVPLMAAVYKLCRQELNAALKRRQEKEKPEPEAKPSPAGKA